MKIPNINSDTDFFFLNYKEMGGEVGWEFYSGHIP